jgi:4-methyl-5(b-hydroxyethyl)-thiazole monophosphate biosynthesis
MSRVLVPLADGFEEMEGMIIVDVLRRAGVEVTTASLKDGPVTASRNTRHLADTTLDAAMGQDFDMIVLPGGGPGAKALEADARIKTILGRMKSSGKKIAAICAAPNVLRAHGVMADTDRFTMYPGMETQAKGGQYVTDRVVRSGNITTSKGPGSAFEFALDLVEQLCGKEKAALVAGPMHLP